MKMSVEEMGRRMMAAAGTLDDDAEFNRWARLGTKLVGMGAGRGPGSIGDLTPEEQQVLARALSRMPENRKDRRVA